MTLPLTRDRLRVAIQRSGRLATPSRDLLASCGLTWRESRDKLFCYGESLPVDLLLVRDDDIPGLIADGVCDLGIVGRNVVAEAALSDRVNGQALVEWRELGWGACRLDIAINEDEEWQGPAQLQGARIATSYPHLLGQWLQEQQVQAEVVTLSGSVEIAPRLGQADLVCDLVSTGGTLAANQLKPVTTLLASTAVVVGAPPPLDDGRGDLADLLMRRMDGALALQDTRLLILRSPRSRWEQVSTRLPEGGVATVLPVEGTDEVSVQVLCSGAVSWTRLEDLKAAGAHSLMVLPVEGMLA